MTASRLFLICALGVPLCIGCANTPVKDAGIRLYVFDCGRVFLDSVQTLGLADTETDERELFVPCYLIDHPDGRLLWEAGLPSSLPGTDDAGRRAIVGGRVQLPTPLREQLASIGLGVADIDLLATSHLHFDHVGQAQDFQDAQLLIQHAEHAVAFAAEPPPTYFPELYAGLADNPTLMLTDVHDVFGDGRVLLLPMPGHTPGHQVLLVELEHSGPLLLAGDVYHLQASRRLARVPNFDANPDQSRHSMAALEALAAARGATVIVTHDPVQHAALPRAPAWLD